MGGKVQPASLHIQNRNLNQVIPILPNHERKCFKPHEETFFFFFLKMFKFYHMKKDWSRTSSKHNTLRSIHSYAYQISLNQKLLTNMATVATKSVHDVPVFCTDACKMHSNFLLYPNVCCYRPVCFTAYLAWHKWIGKRWHIAHKSSVWGLISHCILFALLNKFI